MSSFKNYRCTLEEKLILGGIAYSYGIYFFGGLYITGSLLGYTVLALFLLRTFVEGRSPLQNISPIVYIWATAMMVMLIALLIAHSQWELGTTQTIKSTAGWGKGWFLFALFVFLGTRVRICPQIIVRTMCRLGLYTLIFAVVSFTLYMVGFSGQLFISPLKLIGGAGDNFFTVSLYGYNPETGAGRWQFFAPWAPAAGLVACLFALFCAMEKNIKWRTVGLVGFGCMVLLSQSRAGLAMFVLIIPVFYFSRVIFSPPVLITLGFFIPCVFFFGEPVFEWLMDTHQTIKDARPDSTRVRATLETIALQRWADEAPIWGHGMVERGPKIVEFMPIGSHHTWLGLLFVKGLVGCFAFAVPLLFSLIILIVKHQRSDQVRSGVCMLLIIFGYSFFENIEILAYLIWPVFFWLGTIFQTLAEDLEHEKEI